MIKSILRFLFAGNTRQPLEVLRLPESETEFRSVYGHWDSLNGRYYLYADIVIEPNIFIPHVLFDADTRVAISFKGGDKGLDLKDFFGRKIIASLVTYSTLDYPQQQATAEAQDQFEQQWANKHPQH